MWGFTRRAYEILDGLYDKCPVGSSDTVMAAVFTGMKPKDYKKGRKFSKGLRKSYDEWRKKFEDNKQDLKIGYAENTLKHYYHGKYKNRNYVDRMKFLSGSKFDPY